MISIRCSLGVCKISEWCSFDCCMISYICVSCSLDVPWFLYGLVCAWCSCMVVCCYLGSVWFLSGLLLSCVWLSFDFLDVCMFSLWCVHDVLACVCGVRLIFFWFLYGCLVLVNDVRLSFLGFCMLFLWLLYDFCMCVWLSFDFPWFMYDGLVWLYGFGLIFAWCL